MKNYPVLIGGVGLVKGRIRNFGSAMVEVCEEIGPIIEESKAFEGLPFDEINMIIRWADSGVEQPEIGPLKESIKSLEVATTIKLQDGKAVETDQEKLIELVKSELRKVLKAIEVKYGMHQIDI